MISDSQPSRDAATTPVGVTTLCPQCGVQLDAFTTTCAACGAVITGSAWDKERTERVRARLQEGVGAGFVLGEMLGRGGMGIVFRAREVALDRDVALKVLAFDPVLNPDAYARFEREAKLAAKLDHPHIVPIFGVGQGNGIAFYTMRLVRGGSVETMLAGGTAAGLSHALAILRDVAAALDYAHANGVVHRDIKPANVLIGDAGHAMVADFGIARAFTGKEGATATGTGVVGSPAYMSPEQWRGERVDGRADQYALGVLAFELLTGRRPFAQSSMQELLRMHLTEEPPDIVRFREDLPSHTADAIRRAMAKEPGERFPSATEFVAALSVGSRVSSHASLVRAGVTGGGAAPRASDGAASGAPAGAPTVRTPQPGAPMTRPPQPAASADRPAAAMQPAARAARRAPARSRSRSAWPWAAVALFAAAIAGAIWKLRPGPTASGGEAPAAAPTTPAVNLDSIAAVERDLQQQLAEARRTALEAERRAEELAAAQGAARGGAAEPRHAHVYVFAYGGTPKIVVDREVRNESAPAVLQLPPGRHVLSVMGAQEFLPADTTIELAAEDTQTVVFRATRRRAVGGPAEAGAGEKPIGVAPRVGSGPEQPGVAGFGTSIQAGQRAGAPNWNEIIQRLGFDPRTVDPRTLTPRQRQLYQRFMQSRDSALRSGRRPTP